MNNQKIYYAGAIISLIAIFPFPVSFYFFIRIALCLILLLITYELYRDNIKFWIFSAPLALLYNPIVPIYLHSKSLWILVNISTAIIIMISMYLKKNQLTKEYNMKRYDQDFDNNTQSKKIEDNTIKTETVNGFNENEKKDIFKTEPKINFKIQNLLIRQFDMAGYPNIVDRPDSEFIIGYIFGFCEGYLKHHSIDNNSSEGFSIPSLSLIQIYGSEKGIKIFNEFLDTQLDLTVLQENGRKTGYDEALYCIENGLNPINLSKYILDMDAPHENIINLTEQEYNQVNALGMLIKSFMMQGNGNLMGQFLKKGYINSEDIPRDNWIIGHISGFVRAQLIDWEKDDDGFATVFTNEVIINIYGNTVHFRDYIYLFENRDEKAFYGVEAGFKDYEAKKQQGENKIRTKLTDYVYNQKS